MASFASSRMFDRDTPILRFSRPRKGVKWVLWPIYAWRVVAPLPRDRKLNLFQRAVLGLARAGVCRAAEVAARLMIAEDLAALVAHELGTMGLTAPTGHPTARGLRALEGADDEPSDELHVGHVFTDPFSGKVWPRFVKGDLPVADVELNEEGWPVMMSGSQGDPWRDPAFCLLPDVRDPLLRARPRPEDVLRAARRHRREHGAIDIDDTDDVRAAPSLQRVSLIDEQPVPYLLAVRIGRHPSGDWMVDDPFGYGEAVELRRQLDAQLDRRKGLRTWIAPLVATDPDAPTLAQLQKEAQWAVEARLTLAIQAHGLVHERLVAMQRAMLETRIPGTPADKRDDVLLKAQRSVERTLRTVHDRFRDPARPTTRPLSSSDRDYNRAFLDSVARSLGFDVPLPASLIGVRRGKLQNAEEHGGGSLRPLLLLVLLGADHHAEHPLRRAAGTRRDLLHRLDELATARDSAAHDGDATAAIAAIERHVETAYAAVELLLLR